MFKFFKRRKKQVTLDDNSINLDEKNMPKHIAIIMDGNGRWAKEKNLPRTVGHRYGVEAIREIVRECNKLNIKYLTLYAFSTENWKRSNDEVSALMKLLVEFLRSEFEELNQNNVIINHIGDVSKLPKICEEELKLAYKKTRKNTGLTLNLALNYGGRDEIIRSVKNVVQEVQAKHLLIDDIDEKQISRFLYTSGMPDPDLIIRPSGEHRLSNFLLWQCAYSEFWFSDIKWPDFKREDLRKAIFDYQNRDRRFGAVK